jgi:hypothetical protein
MMRVWTSAECEFNPRDSLAVLGFLQLTERGLQWQSASTRRNVGWLFMAMYMMCASLMLPALDEQCHRS